MNKSDVSQTVGSMRERWGIATFAVGLVFISGIVASGAFAGCQRVAAQQENKPDMFVATSAKPSPTPSASPSPATARKSDGPIVYVTGAVKRPGVYTLPPNARLYHAIRAAGGFKSNAVTDSVNLADFAQDGDQLSIPARKPHSKAEVVVASRPIIIRKTTPPAPVVVALPDTGEPAPIAKASPPAPARVLGEPQPILVEPAMPTFERSEAQTASDIPGAPSDLTPVKSVARSETKAAKPTAPGKLAKFKNPGDGVVHLNTATAEQLEQLPRCGPAMSAKILTYRSQHGGFRSVKELMEIKGVGDKTFENWQPFLAL